MLTGSHEKVSFSRGLEGSNEGITTSGGETPAPNSSHKNDSEIIGPKNADQITESVPASTIKDEWYLDEDNLTLMRVHNTQRLTLYTPTKIRDIPVPLDRLTGERKSNITIVSSGKKIVHSDDWRTTAVPQAVIGDVIDDLTPTEKWTGTTLFALHPLVPRPCKKRTTEERGRESTAENY